MANTKNKTKKASLGETVSIIVNVPTELYYEIKGNADKDTLKQGEKKTIHDRLVDDLYKANPNVKRS